MGKLVSLYMIALTVSISKNLWMAVSETYCMYNLIATVLFPVPCMCIPKVIATAGLWDDAHNMYTQVYIHRHTHSHLYTCVCIFTVTEMTSYYENLDVCTTHSEIVSGVSIIHMILVTLSCTSVGWVCTCTWLHAVKWEEKGA